MSAKKPAAAAPEQKQAKQGRSALPLAASRPRVTVFGVDGKATKENIKKPAVLIAPIRPDIVQFVHTSMAKNRRQAYAVSADAGMQHSAESWGTGRAVARIPRVSGGGTSRAGQAAFGNMCRKGRMFAPTQTFRKWHRKLNTNQKRYAVASALAASALYPLVTARGHRVDNVPELPLVVSDEAAKIQKTANAVTLLNALGANDDVEKVRASRKLRAGVGKMRNRRYVARRGPLVIHNEEQGADSAIARAFRNLPGVEICHVDRLNLLQLAPGGHLGRFIIWTAGAFRRLDSLWGTWTRQGAKKDYILPRPIMFQSDLTRLINSDEVQRAVRPAQRSVRRAVLKRNPLKNLGAMVKLNPAALAQRRREILTQRRSAAHRAEILAARRAGKKPAMTASSKAHLLAQKKHRANKIKNYRRLAGVVPVVTRKQRRAAAAATTAAAAAPAKKQ